MFNWVRVHRVHHKFSETTKDPLDFHRGFFFAHVGWYCLDFHPDCAKEMKRIDLDDLKADKDIMFQYQLVGIKFSSKVQSFIWNFFYFRNYELLFLFINILIPVLAPCYFWGESLWIAFWVCFVTRFCINFTQLNFTNSANHFIGTHPYDKNSSATDNIAMVLTSFGEGWVQGLSIVWRFNNL